MNNYILKPCPFCGGKAEIHKVGLGETHREKQEDIPSRINNYYRIESNHGEVYYSYNDFAFVIRCKDKRCVGRSMKQFFDEAEAVEAWNRRAKNEVQ